MLTAINGVTLMTFLKRLFSNLFGYYKENAQLVIKIFGIKMKFHYANINQLEDVCCIQNLEKLKQNKTYFPHPIGIVVHPDVKIGKDCIIYQNVTIGRGKFNKSTNMSVPTIGNNVTIYANSIIIGGITIGNNTIIGAGAVVLNDIPENAIVVGNPAHVIKYQDK